MSKISLSPNASGTGTLTIAAPNTNSDITLNLPTTMGTNNGSSVVTTDAAGNLGLGVAPSPSYKLDIRGAQDDTTNFLFNGLNIVNTSNQGGVTNKTAIRLGVQSDSGIRAAKIVAYEEGTNTHAIGLSFYTNNTNADDSSTERARIDSSGNLLVGTTSAAQESGVGFKANYSATVPTVNAVVNTNANNSTYHLYNTNATNNGYRFYVSATGGISNYSGSNVNLSDERTKTNIELAGGYLAKICSIPVKLFNYKDEPEGEQRTLGVIAQDVEAVAPEFVNTDGWKGTAPEDGIPLKSIYTTDMVFGMMKAIQELKAIVDAQGAEIATLTAAVAASKGTA